MKYHIASTYISSHPAVDSWRQETSKNSQLHFLEWLKKQTGTDFITGNFEDGWTIHFHDDATYTWFLLKWGK